MVEGTVEWFDPQKGYGFIRPDNAKRDIFLHYTALVMDGYKTVNEGTRVVFRVVEGRNGPQAAEVTVNG
jgi:cold shock protein